MIVRALIALAVAGLVLAACGPPPITRQEQICGPGGCDSCIGLNCSADGGVR